jgi:predicted lipoprotein with Yx(FWY)xxD motif
MTPNRVLSTLVLVAAITAACSATGGSPAAASAPAPAGGSGAPAAEATVGTASSSTFGTILTGANGMTLYTYSADSAGTSTCTGGCATAWPPLTVPAGQQPTAGSGVTGTLSTLTRADGTIQVAYDGHPLYYWQADAKPGDVTGDGVNGFSVAKAAGGGAAPASSAPSPGPSSAPSGSGRYGY